MNSIFKRGVGALISNTNQRKCTFNLKKYIRRFKMAKITVTNTQGLNQIRSGNGVVLQNTPTVSAEVGLVAQSTASLPGVYTIAGAGASDVLMPLAADSLGGVFVFRSTSAQAHFLTGSSEAAGTAVFTNGTSKGSKLALAAAVGNSVTLMSDGKNFCVLGNSGSLALSNT